MSKKRTKASSRRRQAAARARRQSGLTKLLDPETEYRATMLSAGLSTEPRPVEVLLAASKAKQVVVTIITGGEPASTTAAWDGLEVLVGEPLVESDLHELIDTGVPAQIVVAALPDEAGEPTRLMGWSTGADGVQPMDPEQVRTLTSTDPRTGELLPPEPDLAYVTAPQISFHYR